MSSTTYNSKFLSYIDIPDIQVFDAKFVYSYFTKDESVNNATSITLKFDESIQHEVDREHYPRHVQFSIKPLHDFATINYVDNAVGQIRKETVKNSTFTAYPTITENISKIVSEERFTKSGFTGIDIVDDNIDGKLHFIVSGTVTRKISNTNLSHENKISENEKLILTTLSEGSTAPDLGRFLASKTKGRVNSQTILDALDQIKTERTLLIDDKTKEVKISDTFEDLKNLTFRMQLNNKVISKLVKSAKDDPIGLHADEFASFYDTGAPKEIENAALVGSSHRTIDDSDMGFVVDQNDIVAARKLESDSDIINFKPSFSLLGYVIEKKQLLDDGQLLDLGTIVIENKNATSAVDTNVIYGATYIYLAKAIAAVELPAYDDGTNAGDVLSALTIFVSSRANKKIVRCFEETPPQHPADFSIGYDDVEKGLRLLWSFPNDRQRDVKRFQVFRRNSIMAPFTLINEIIFDDSIIKYEKFESIDRESITDVTEEGPRTFFIDKDFSVSSPNIYAICSIDAHGLTSNYSSQIEVTFDKLTRRISKRMISTSGAPKQYPNLKIEEDLFVDLCKVSGYESCTIFLDPEYLNVVSPDGTDLKLLKTTEKDSYIVQMINVDIQKSKELEIKLREKSRG